MIEIQKVFSILNKNKVYYLVVGGIAVNLYGIERATADIDIVVDLEEKNLRKFIAVMKKYGFKSKVSVKLDDFVKEENRNIWIKEKNMKVFSIYNPKNPFLLIDIFVEMPFDFRKVYNERNRMKAGNVAVPVAPLKYLIRMKEKAGRPQDKADVFYLKKIAREWNDEN